MAHAPAKSRSPGQVAGLPESPASVRAVSSRVTAGITAHPTGVFAAIFRALRPTWRAVNYVQPIEESPLELSGGIQWPLQWPITVSASRIQHRQAVPNIGDAVATIVEFTLIAGDQGLTNPTIVHDDSGRYASLTQSFTSGQKVLFYNLTPDDIGVQAGNNDLAQFLDTASRAIPLYIGENNLTIHCESGNGTVQMRYLPEYNGG